ncbi:MAG: nucleotide exchange factor GrpE [Chloroflexi bacterium]|nr:nucleotide exchange factor GrpE [Chloroflexota bacterium]
MAETQVPENGKHHEPLHETEAFTPGQAGNDPQTLQRALAEAQAKAEEYLAGWQRERAEFANYRQRVEQQAAQTRDRVRGDVLKGLIDILDDLDLALQNRPTEGEAAAWAEGIVLIAQKIRTFLQQQGLEVIDPQPGDPFDPYLHEAIAVEPSDEVESGHIVSVLRKGYRVGDRVLRPALVRVAQ